MTERETVRILASGIGGLLKLTALPCSLPDVLAFASSLDALWGHRDILIALDVGRLCPSAEDGHCSIAGALSFSMSALASTSSGFLLRILCRYLVNASVGRNVQAGSAFAVCDRKNRAEEARSDAAQRALSC